jgi:hypothetical protein
MTDKDEIAALKARLAALEAKVSPPESDFVPMSDAEHRDMVHQMRERQASTWMPPSAVQEMVAAEPKGFMQGVVHDNRAPNSPSTLPRTEGVRPGNVAGSGTGWAREIPLSPPPGVAQADKLMDVQDAKDRHERVVEEAQRLAMLKVAEPK